MNLKYSYKFLKFCLIFKIKKNDKNKTANAVVWGLSSTKFQQIINSYGLKTIQEPDLI